MKHINNNKGAAMIMVAVAIVMLFAFSVLAIDISIIMLAKTQLQNAADAAAISGATAYYLSSGNQSIATQEAIAIAGMNVAIQDSMRSVIIGADDVSFPDEKRITVYTNRTEATGDPIQLYFLRVLDPLLNNLGEMRAKATARVYPVSGTDCLKPWSFPDQWDDADNDSIYDVGEFYDPAVTGYKAPDDIGKQIILKLRNSNKSPRMGWYYAVDFAPINTEEPTITGADAYREWIATCEPFMVTTGDKLQIEPGNMQGPTAQGVEALITLDPTAEWDPVSGTVINSAFPTSPRIIKCAIFDPTVGIQTDVNGRDYVIVVKVLAAFLEEFNGSDVTARFIRRVSDGDICTDCEDGFLFKAVLVE
jgi:Flp pilus assembly protein TadG